MAEAFFNHLTGSRRATSAACQDFRQKYQGLITPDIIATMNDVGIDISRQRMKVVTPELVRQADRVVVLCDPKFCPDFLLAAGSKVVMMTLNDPHDQSAVAIAQIRDQIQELVKKFI